MTGQFIQRLLAAGARAHATVFSRQMNDRFQALTRGLVIFHDGDFDHDFSSSASWASARRFFATRSPCGHSKGMRNSTMVPALARLIMEQVPPKWAIRSRIPVIPSLLELGW